MNILVLGGEGQIGKPVCKHFRELGHDVTSYDIKTHPWRDLRIHTTEFYRLVRDTDFVIYLASDVGGAKYLSEHQNQYDFIGDNLRMMVNVFQQLKFHKKPFIFTSSQMAAQPHTVYGNMKLVGEKATAALGGVCVRLWNVYGEEEYGEKSHVITDFIEQAKSGKIVSRTNGEEERQFLHADDFCKCVEKIVKNYQQIDKTKPLDVSSFEWVSIKRIADIISDVCGCDVIFSDHKDDTQKNYRNDPSRDVLEFWQPKISLEEGISKIILGMK